MENITDLIFTDDIGVAVKMKGHVVSNLGMNVRYNSSGYRSFIQRRRSGISSVDRIPIDRQSCIEFLSKRANKDE